ncbi:putative signal transducing protein [Phycisphaerales bacterium AB-hyl4]|uniref:Signal transducing protein n=1 Tax=Natronomicrosphaera hydrolytica TaxID=3242702 RepID=A0ABV4TZH4_9BACT
MSNTDDMIVVYEAGSLAEAQLLSDRLASADISNHVANVDSPFDGLVAGHQTVPVRVLSHDAERARQIVDEFMNEHAD